MISLIVFDNEHGIRDRCSRYAQSATISKPKKLICQGKGYFITEFVNGTVGWISLSSLKFAPFFALFDGPEIY